MRVASERFPVVSYERLGMYSGGGNALASSFMQTAENKPESGGGPLGAVLEELLALAREAARHSYSPYSEFKVGAALKLTSGEIVTGTNVENASYGLTVCAERAALVRAVAMFGPEIRIAAAAVANLNDAPSPPCGACRQVLAEFMLPETPVAFPAQDGMRAMPLSALLPMAFEKKRK